MNIENIDKLIKWVKQDKKKSIHEFNMSVWIEEQECGTILCLGGACNILEGTETPNNVTALKWLDLDYDLSKLLFYPPVILNYKLITHDHALAVLKKLKKKGLVDWMSFIHLSPNS